MAGAITVNRGNILLSECSFTANEGTQGGAVKMFYNVGGTVIKDLYITIDRCLFSGNKTSDSGAAIMGRNTEQVNIINSTFYGNEAPKGGAIYMNAPGYYSNKLNVVSSTVAGNKADRGSDIYTNGSGVINMANSIVVANTEANPIADLSSTAGYKFLGYNVVGPVAEGYSTSDVGWGYFPNNIKQWNYKYKVAFALLDSNGNAVQTFIDKDCEPSDWVEGNPFNYKFEVSPSVPAGEYTWGAAIVDTRNDNKPGIELAVSRTPTASGRIRLSQVKVN